ncbi:hypothetical protein ACLIMP_22595 [Novosphingobium aerophilum]|uniref:hypothetical protein n=1 Tax=Novosphingobium aerophilum TaxID=2839843 RepID=UPI003FD3C867
MDRLRREIFGKSAEKDDGGEKGIRPGLVEGNILIRFHLGAQLRVQARRFAVLAVRCVEAADEAA